MRHFSAFSVVEAYTSSSRQVYTQDEQKKTSKPPQSTKARKHIKIMYEACTVLLHVTAHEIVQHIFRSFVICTHCLLYFVKFNAYTSKRSTSKGLHYMHYFRSQGDVTFSILNTGSALEGK